ncbi:hypothetical protein [Acetobacter estunensis]|uniref:hypothetical protein n=1 Tax=Acetobacter estunensis TaxID=104097 RepID=UPI001C2CD71B|nr:hypothetical protein [Acetobacter estunensis]
MFRAMLLAVEASSDLIGVITDEASDANLWGAIRASRHFRQDDAVIKLLFQALN